ncbi:MAG TPA: methylenetetrahydrofolate reductase [NAD(P)H] [Candidatus Baltobacteraceae bacterium]|jgi:methylenetetrahydrofolate reductase (NADPH)|nr:methylenetetrahydrofolate reductase [NAD(P)H] [Candidatus Baltobacteraceae bacterium]
MRISEALEGQRPFFSFEFFPPRTDEAYAHLLETAATLRELRPAFVSVTYGAMGSTRARTIEVSKQIQNDIGLTVMAHVTCVGSSRADLRATLNEIEAAGIENVLALRGDPPRDASVFETPPGGFSHANELAAMIQRNYHFCIGGACYPEKHVEAASLEDDLYNCKRKVEAGAAFLITQLFFDNDRYFTFVDRARAAGITVPILPGIMPITNYEQIQRFTAMCGATIPPKLLAELDLRRDQPKAVEELGVAYATLQCTDLLRRGAPGVHFYTLNKSPATRAIVSALLAATAWRTFTPR